MDPLTIECMDRRIPLSSICLGFDLRQSASTFSAFIDSFLLNIHTLLSSFMLMFDPHSFGLYFLRATRCTPPILNYTTSIFSNLKLYPHIFLFFTFFHTTPHLLHPFSSPSHKPISSKPQSPIFSQSPISASLANPISGDTIFDVPIFHLHLASQKHSNPLSSPFQSHFLIILVSLQNRATGYGKDGLKTTKVNCNL